VVEEDHTHTMLIFGIMFQNVIPLMSFEKQHSRGPVLTPKMKYLVELMIMFSTRQMGYFDMLQCAKRFRPRAYRLRHAVFSTKWFNVYFMHVVNDWFLWEKIWWKKEIFGIVLCGAWYFLIQDPMSQFYYYGLGMLRHRHCVVIIIRQSRTCGDK
jgi:hypothetical protein